MFGLGICCTQLISMLAYVGILASTIAHDNFLDQMNLLSASDIPSQIGAFPNHSLWHIISTRPSSILKVIFFGIAQNPVIFNTCPRIQTLASYDTPQYIGQSQVTGSVHLSSSQFSRDWLVDRELLPTSPQHRHTMTGQPKPKWLGPIRSLLLKGRLPRQAQRCGSQDGWWSLVNQRPWQFPRWRFWVGNDSDFSGEMLCEWF